MRALLVEFWGLEGSQAEAKLQGTITLRNGVYTATGCGEWVLEEASKAAHRGPGGLDGLLVVGCGPDRNNPQPARQYVPEDGENFLNALAWTFRSPYLGLTFR